MFGSIFHPFSMVCPSSPPFTDITLVAEARHVVWHVSCQPRGFSPQGFEDLKKSRRQGTDANYSNWRFSLAQKGGIRKKNKSGPKNWEGFREPGNREDRLEPDRYDMCALHLHCSLFTVHYTLYTHLSGMWRECKERFHVFVLAYWNTLCIQQCLLWSAV